MCRTREQGTSKDRWQPEDVLGSSIFNTAPVPDGVGSGQTRQKVHHAVPHSLHPPGSSETTTRPGQLLESHSMSSQLGFLSEVDPGQWVLMSAQLGFLMPGHPSTQPQLSGNPEGGGNPEKHRKRDPDIELRT